MTPRPDDDLDATTALCLWLLLVVAVLFLLINGT